MQWIFTQWNAFRILMVYWCACMHDICHMYQVGRVEIDPHLHEDQIPGKQGIFRPLLAVHSALPARETGHQDG